MSIVESVDYLCSTPNTRSNESDTLFYLVNYVNNKGFALLSADDRMFPVYAMSDEGHLNMADTTFNEGLKLFYRQAQASALAISLTPIDFVMDPFNYEFDRTVPPKLSVDIRNLGQGSPYNKFCKTSTGETAQVGCGPIAVGSVLAHYSMPKTMCGQTVDWNAIHTTFKSDNLYQFLSNLGSSDYLGVTYGTNVTMCKVYAIPTTLRLCGLSCSYWQSFNKYEAAAAIEKSPILIFGEDGQANHFWVMDGYIRWSNAHLSTEIPESNVRYPYFFFHCCWGWNGNGNGYYYFYSNETIKGTANMHDSTDGSVQYYVSYYSMRMITNIEIDSTSQN